MTTKFRHWRFVVLAVFAAVGIVLGALKMYFIMTPSAPLPELVTPVPIVLSPGVGPKSKRRLEPVLAAEPVALNAPPVVSHADQEPRKQPERLAPAASPHAPVHEASEIVHGTWVGTYPCAAGGDIHIALQVSARGALVYFHSGSHAAPTAPGCYTARWTYNAERTLVEVHPQGWLWRVGQTTPLKLSGWVNHDYIVGGAEDMAGCREFALHKRAGYEFPAECR